MDNLHSIFFEGELTEAQLRDYLEGKLSGEDLKAVEKIIQESPFSGDAVDGLKQIASTKKLDSLVRQLNANMQTHLSITKAHRKKRTIPNLYWTILAILLILFICFLGYWIISGKFL
ncbi:MAG: hypothetical protein JSS67_05235 [Bacteroidetes bacterium]|nr:hypothetical protein [Bacteroidota bacterium]